MGEERTPDIRNTERTAGRQNEPPERVVEVQRVLAVVRCVTSRGDEYRRRLGVELQVQLDPVVLSGQPEDRVHVWVSVHDSLLDERSGVAALHEGMLGWVCDVFQGVPPRPDARLSEMRVRVDGDTVGLVDEEVAGALLEELDFAAVRVGVVVCLVDHLGTMLDGVQVANRFARVIPERHHFGGAVTELQLFLHA